jgi:hypothetical protein
MVCAVEWCLSGHWHCSRSQLMMGPTRVIFLLYERDSLTRFFDSRFFFMKCHILVSIDMLKSDFEFCGILLELFILKILKNRLPTVTDRGSKKLSLRQPIFFTLLKCSWWAVLYMDRSYFASLSL